MLGKFRRHDVEKTASLRLFRNPVRKERIHHANPIPTGPVPVTGTNPQSPAGPSPDDAAFVPQGVARELPAGGTGISHTGWYYLKRTFTNQQGQAKPDMLINLAPARRPFFGIT
jgi:hypothetical protein